MRVVKRLILVLIAVAVVAGLVFASLPKPPKVDVAPVERGELQATVDGDGRTRVQDRYVVAAPLYGNLARIDLDPGDDIDEGTVLARITPLDPPLLDTRAKAEMKARVLAADASRRQADAATHRANDAAAFSSNQLEKLRKLAAQGGISQSELDAAELDARHTAKALESAKFGERVAKYELEMARAAAGRKETGGEGGGSDQLEIRAPVRGRVLRIVRESEGVVNPGEALVEVGDPHALEIVVDILTEDAVEVRPGAAVTVERWGGDQPLHGTVRLVEPSAYTKVSALGVEEQRVDVVIEIAEAPDVWSGLGDGYRVEVKIVVWEGDSVMKIPAGALHRRGDEWATFVVEHGIAHERTIELGRRSGLQVEVASGLTTDEQVILHPSDAITDGSAVEPR